jgi:hypothetical protein
MNKYLKNVKIGYVRNRLKENYTLSKKGNKQKLTGKEMAKINTRKKFYKKFERLCQIAKEKDEENQTIIPLSYKKTKAIEEFDEFSRLFERVFNKSEEPIDMEHQILDVPFLEDGVFILKAAQDKLLEIIRHETYQDDHGNPRKGRLENDESYQYQSAFYWAMSLNPKNIEKVLDLLEKEKEDPTDYDMTIRTQKIKRRKHYPKGLKQVTVRLD